MSIVLKFGGSSITKDGFKTILNEIKNNKGKKIVIVLSAVYNITNILINLIEKKLNYTIQNLVDIHYKLIEEIGLEHNFIDSLIVQLKEDLTKEKINKPKVLSYGELLSTIILFEYLKKSNVTANVIDGTELIRSSFSMKEIIDKSCKAQNFYCDDCIHNYIENNEIIITQGFITKTKDNYIYTLTRGGSDTTASLIAAKINCERLEIWTDVNGVYDADPNIIDESCIINNLDYELCQEMAGMGAKVLHPYCIRPCQEKNIPIYIKNTYDSINNNNTVIANEYNNKLSLMFDKGNTVFNITSLNMWNDYGFVADIFLKFKNYSIDINIITTSQYSVLATTKELDKKKILSLKEELSKYYDVSLFDCDLISIIGRDIIQNKKIPYLFEKLNNHNKIYITHFSSNNMCLTFAISNEISNYMYKKIYNLILSKNQTVDSYQDKWWYKKISNLRSSMEEDSVYVYDLETIDLKCKTLATNLNSVDKLYYAIKANNNLDVLKCIYNNNFGFECVSIDEVRYIRKHFINADILFTPNYCKPIEYEIAYNFDCDIIVDNYEVIENNADLFRNKEIGIRLDLNLGDGHDHKVVTEGSNSKFGMSVNDISKLLNLCTILKIKIVGLHSHRGSDINNINSWLQAFEVMSKLSIIEFDDIKWINLGGGLGTKLQDKDFKSLNEILNIKKDNINIWMEPGRFLVSESGVLLSKVNQIRTKNTKNIIGISTGMNSLIRPALYDAYHNIYNLSKINNINNKNYDIVGPICESGDVLGKNRIFPETEVGDIILIENAGAYGKVMSSNYNMRNSANEIILENEISGKSLYNKENDVYISYL